MKKIKEHVFYFNSNTLHNDIVLFDPYILYKEVINSIYEFFLELLQGAPTKTIEIFASLRPVNLQAFIRPASTTIAVPCWSS